MTQGLDVRTGAPVRVGVIDSGFDPRQPQLAGVPVVERNEIGGVDFDCVGHGTGVASIIAAQPSRQSTFVGVAPKAMLFTYKVTNNDNVAAAATTRALKAAIDDHVQVINMSESSPVRPPAPEMLQLQRAQRLGIVIVAAGGNDNTGQSVRPQYPAALSNSLSNIIAVSATAQDDRIANFRIPGSYVDVAAPGVDVTVAARAIGYSTVSGTSYAAPFVTGTVALVLAAHPDFTPQQVRSRLEATADPPPGAVPDGEYGWGVINPLRAVTSVDDDNIVLPTPAPAAAIAPPSAIARPDRSLQHRALGVAFVLLGLAALTVAAATVLRGRSRTGRHVPERV